jgi:hypothetical protein
MPRARNKKNADWLGKILLSAFLQWNQLTLYVSSLFQGVKILPVLPGIVTPNVDKIARHREIGATPEEEDVRRAKSNGFLYPFYGGSARSRPGLERSVKAGAKGVLLLPTLSPNKSHAHPDYDCFWAVAQEFDVPVSIHPCSEPQLNVCTNVLKTRRSRRSGISTYTAGSFMREEDTIAYDLVIKKDWSSIAGVARLAQPAAGREGRQTAQPLNTGRR